MTEDRIQYELQLLRREISLIDITAHTVEGWLPRKYLMRFLNVGDTTMNSIEKTEKLMVSKVGARKFYHIKSITELLKRNITSV